ncbi:hypothetical protein [Mycobacterium sp. E2479]
MWRRGRWTTSYTRRMEQ